MMARPIAVLLLWATACTASADTSPAPEQILERMHAAYAAMTSYADEGTVILEERPIGATVIREQYRFTTRYAAPKRFYFEAKKASSGERFVVWCPGESFNSWWSATGVHDRYAAGEGADAFAVAALPTAGSVLLVPSLLFKAAGLQGPLVTMKQPKYAGRESLDGHATYKLIAPVRLNHWSDTVRMTTVWIDAKTWLVRKVFEDTPTGMGGAIQRTTTLIEPRSPATTDASHFRFAPPSG